MVFPLHEVVEIVLGADLLADPEDVSRYHLGVQLDEIARRIPLVACLAQQVVGLEGLGREPQFGEWQLQPAGVGVVRIQVHHCQNDVGEIRRVFTVADQLLVVDRMEAQAAVALQRGVVPADPVDAGDEVLEAAGGVDVPCSGLEFLGVQVFLAAGLAVERWGVAPKALAEILGRWPEVICRWANRAGRLRLEDEAFRRDFELLDSQMSDEPGHEGRAMGAAFERQPEAPRSLTRRLDTSGE